MDDDEAGDTYNMDGDDLYGDDMYDDLYNAPTEAKTVSEARVSCIASCMGVQRTCV
ncbi:hypothetical protein SARC_16576 [Sphaeroforma arctica JP610]|uniref:Uncharacterized protein n=1 Tax=Sphaeroforma arctica JP610 TaxID=667725 RepID=A0A0L0F2H7_9EUKA|nr:hypothetical protein SARC_16576 [Sphaeroforma arctica JP610]KNC70892.1 hypothetical protein SARC_16576 [Sphaeroforma arctica JP610]|eukprot:XP_014144794.1 hypothetical protein SARC_16576 [Sphaeroforma arctica JP610]